MMEIDYSNFLPKLVDLKPEMDINIEKKFSLICKICGDKSKSYHYDVPTCNGCKTFFRRTVITRRVHKCIQGGNCVITKG